MGEELIAHIACPDSHWNRLDRHVVSAESIGSFKRRLDESMDRDDR